MFIKETYTVNLTFGQWLKNARTERGYSLRTLEALTNKICTYGYLNQLERGVTGKKGAEYQPDLEIVEALAIALKKPIDEARLAAGYAPKNQLPPVPKPIIEALAREGTLHPDDEILIADFITRLKREK